ncbi:putative membrane spanning protein [Borrelia duttonii CR2A]|uniref:Putative membrane spanning protein n=1 Tax=Borrelia duttonii CR2A TaxID=1432657 RepID=W6TKQ1_9SPIR|nr:virulence associated lipoprotein [Borrelia duttonii]ETZ17869.1 putative membrane spanning protein [Borrelia duttonii CR2A]
MSHKIPIIFILIAVTILTCKANFERVAKLEQALREIELQTIEQTIKNKVEVSEISGQQKSTAVKTNVILDKIDSLAISTISKLKELTQKEQDLKTQKEDLTKEKKRIEEQAKQNLQQRQQQVELEEAKIELKQKIQDIQKSLILYKNNYYNEPVDQFGMHDSNNHRYAFDLAETLYLKYSDQKSQEYRHKIYLLFDYNDAYIRSLGEFLNKMAQNIVLESEFPSKMSLQFVSQNEEVKNLLQKILSNIDQYFELYFHTAFDISENQQAEIDFLTLDDIKTLNNIFDERRKINDYCKMFVKKIYEDFQDDKDEIRTGEITKLMEYIKKIMYDQKFLDIFQSLKMLIGKVENYNLK